MTAEGAEQNANPPENYTRSKSSVQLLRLNKGFWCSVSRVDEADVLRIAPRGVDGQEHQGLIVQQSDRVVGGFLEEDQLPHARLEPFPFANLEQPAAGHNEQVLVAGRVVVGRNVDVDAEDAAAGFPL